MVKLVAFDLFGTLVFGNAEPGPYTRICRELEVSRHELSVVAQTVNCSVADLIDRLAPMKPEAARRATAERVQQELAHDLSRIALFPESVQVLSALQSRGYRTAIVSNLATPYAAPALELLRSHSVLPETCIWSFEVGAKKPETQIYQRLFDRTGCRAEEVLFVGDRADRDLWPPRKLGCVSRLVARPSDPRYHRAIQGVPEIDRIESLADIFAVLTLTPSLPKTRGLERPLSP